MELRESVVLVTGAGRGIGRATALAFARFGARVALLATTRKHLLDVQKEIKPLGVATAILSADVSDEGAVARAVAATEQQLGPVDILVNNAGIYADGPLERFDTIVFDRLIAVNLRGPFLMIRAVLPGMKARRRGHILNVSSTAVRRGYAGGGPYCASKFGLAGLSESVMQEARPFDVRVSCLFPSTVATDMARRGGFAGDEARSIHPEDVADAIVSLAAMENRAMVTGIELWQTNPKPAP